MPAIPTIFRNVLYKTFGAIIQAIDYINQIFFKNIPYENFLHYYDEEDGLDYRNAFLECVSYCQSNKKTVFMPEGTYYISGVVTITGDISIYAPNVLIQSDIINGNFLIIQGSVGSFMAVTESLERGQNYIKSTLASSLTAGDLLHVKSDQPFTNIVGYNESVGRGEMAIVRNVDTVNSVVFLHNGLESDYSIDNWDDAREEPAVSTPANVGIAKVTPAKVNLIGNPKIINTTTDYDTEGNDDCNGLRLVYLKDVNLDITIENFPQRLLELTHCYSGVVNFNGRGAARDSSESGDGSPGYGLEIKGVTMNVKLNCQISGCRHPVVHNGLDGVAWNNEINGVLYGARGNACIDSHSPLGSMKVGIATLIGGDLVRIEDSLNSEYDLATGSKAVPLGIEYGGKYNYINDVTFKNISTCFLHREQCAVDEIIINNVQYDNCVTLIAFRNTGNETSYVNKFSIGKIRGTKLTNMMQYYHRVFKGKEIIFNDAEIDGKLMSVFSGARSDSDKVSFIFNNLLSRKHADFTAGQFIYLVANSKCVDEIRLNGKVIDHDKLIDLSSTSEINDIIINGLRYDGEDLINIQGDVEADRCNLVSILNSQIETTNTNLLNFEEADQTLKNLIYDNNYVKGATQITNGTATNNIGGNTIFDN